MTMLTTPAEMAAWVLLSRIFQLSLELNTPLRHSTGPILKTMYLEGLLTQPLRGTKKNKQMVLRALVDAYRTIFADWQPSDTVQRALDMAV